MNLADHEQFMRRAIELASNAPQLPFGAVIVDRQSNRIIAEGWNRGSENPIWHGEIDALNHLASRSAGNAIGPLLLYTTAEPCPMCQSAILWAGLAGVVFGTSIRTLQRMGWRQIDIVAEEVIRRTPFASCTLLGGVLERQCDALFAGIAR
jgi:tRNA(Arg) A34 adenosine deaminase TadA